MNCNICFESAKRPHVTICGHIYCGEHIHKWLAEDYSCPVCRKKLTHNKEQLIEIYHNQGEVSLSNETVPGKAENSKALDDEADEKAAVLSILGDLQKRWEMLLMERTRLRVEKKDLHDKNDKLEAEVRMLKQRLMAERGLGKTGVHDSSQRESGNFSESIELQQTANRASESSHYEASIPPFISKANSRMESYIILEESICTPWREGLVERMHSEPVHGIAIHDSLPIVATASWDHKCGIYYLDSGDRPYLLHDPELHRGLYDVEFCKTQSGLLGTVSSDGGCIIWDFAAREIATILRGHGDEVNSLSFHSNFDVVATASDDRTVRLWDFNRGETISILRGHRNNVYGVSYDKGDMLASASFDWMTLVWDTRIGSVIHSLEGHTNDIIGVDFDSNGFLLATGSDDGTCRIWDTRTWKTIAVLTEHQGEVKKIKFSPHGRGLATCSGDGTCKVWDMVTMECTSSLEGHGGHVFDAAWSPDSATLVTASHDTTWRLWDHQSALR